MDFSYTMKNYYPYSTKRRSLARATAAAILLSAPVCAVFGAGTGTETDPITGADVKSTIDTGKVYLVDVSQANTGILTTDFLTVGLTKSGNKLTISGTSLDTEGGVLGSGKYDADKKTTSTSSGNIVILGKAAEWDTGAVLLLVGEAGGQNKVNVTGKSFLSSHSTTIGSAHELNKVSYASNGNSLSLSDIGSEAKAGFLIIGEKGSENSVSVGKGTTLTASSVDVGLGEIDAKKVVTKSDKNTLTISGVATERDANNVLLVKEAIFTNTGALNIGVYGSENKVEIDGGAVATSGSITLGTNEGSDNNSLSISGSTLIGDTTYVTKLTTTGSKVSVGINGAGNSLSITEGTTLTGTGFALNIGDEASADNNTVKVDGKKSTISGITWTDIGNEGSANKLEVTNGATYTSTGSFKLGEKGSDNTVLFDNATVSIGDDNYTYIGDGYYGWSKDADGKTIPGSPTYGSGNSMTIQGATSYKSGYTDVGYWGSSNKLEILGSSTVTLTRRLKVGNGIRSTATNAEGKAISDYASYGCNNSVLVSGHDASDPKKVTRSTLDASSNDIYIGLYGSGNSLTVSDGAVLKNAGSTYVGHSGSDNKLIVSDSEASISYLSVGSFGTANEISFTNSSVTMPGSLDVGYGELSDVANDNTALGSYNSVLIDGSTLLAAVGKDGAKDTGISFITLGYYGSYNTIDIKNKSNVLVTGDITIGAWGHTYKEGVSVVARYFSRENELNISSSIVSATTINIGEKGRFNRISIENGSNVKSTTVNIGVGDARSPAKDADKTVGYMNDVYVSGNGTTLITKNINLGTYGSANTLSIDSKALVQTDVLSISNDSATDVLKGEENYICLSNGGYLALFDKFTKDQVIASGNYMVWDHASYKYVPAASGNISAKYYISDEDAKKGTGYDYLAGYTVISGGDKYIGMGWAGLDTDNKPNSSNWFKSEWLGTFYAEVASYPWIYTNTHGWQYVIEGDKAICLYDSVTSTWWYVSIEKYPYMYNYSTGNWYCLINGNAPERVFYTWNATGEGYVLELSDSFIE